MALTIADLLALEGVSVSVAYEFPGLPFTAYRIEGPGYSTVLNIRADGTVFDPEEQESLDNLVDSDLHSERLFGVTEPNAAAARVGLLTQGYTVTMTDFTIGAWQFEVQPPEGEPVTGRTAQNLSDQAEALS